MRDFELKRNFWRPSERTAELHECVGDRLGWSPCAGGHNASGDGSGYCEPEYAGPRCEVCILEFHYFDTSDARCHSCNGVATKAMVRVTVPATVASVAIILVNAAHSNWAPHSTIATVTLLRVRQLVVAWEQHGMQSKMKQAITQLGRRACLVHAGHAQYKPLCMPIACQVPAL